MTAVIGSVLELKFDMISSSSTNLGSYSFDALSRLMTDNTSVAAPTSAPSEAELDICFFNRR